MKPNNAFAKIGNFSSNLPYKIGIPKMPTIPHQNTFIASSTPITASQNSFITGYYKLKML